MDNVCHTLVGVAVARTGLREKTALATATAAIAANLPDIDVLVFATGIPSVAFRRGITHGVPAQVLLPIACAGLMWLIGRRRQGALRSMPSPHFGWLLVLSYIGIFTHVFLDFLNTYGVRLLSPMSQRWFYGDSVFIVDVWLWLALGAGVILARRSHPGFAAAGLAVAALYVALMITSARMARQIVHDAWVARSGAAPRALMVGPVPVNPFCREIIVDAGDRYVEGAFRWMPTRVEFDDRATLKNDEQPGVERARQDPAIAGILVWSRFPAWETREVPGGLEVRLRDMRFRRISRGGFTAATIVPR
jgi:inner membrane protein